MQNHDECDKCGCWIINGQCSCSFWFRPGREPPFLKTLERAILSYDHACEQTGENEPLVGDHYSGTCIVLFKGTAEDAACVKQFILEMKNV